MKFTCPREIDNRTLLIMAKSSVSKAFYGGTIDPWQGCVGRFAETVHLLVKTTILKQVQFMQMFLKLSHAAFKELKLQHAVLDHHMLDRGKIPCWRIHWRNIRSMPAKFAKKAMNMAQRRQRKKNPHSPLTSTT
ncbi:hypothetical protein IF1G_04394 [Cordyceps javanica]|uniref:Uncharacterized protein n=1 Tax=Cordyceps javanica TaxID=43265 RepID=A0A545V618_9HYPO|nr:hypothetical protein IF1G_04394 [Cordyceps javanica]